MFLETRSQGGLTLAPLKQTPTRVLDLGCGGGLWAIDAARRWKVRRCLDPVPMFTMLLITSANRTQ